jgi:ABC-type sugar transport system ATPase subunit
MSLLQVLDAHKKEGKNTVLQGISFTLQKLQKLAIAGETGSGKTSLLKIVAGIESPASGNVLFENVRLKRIPEEKLIPGHPGIAYLSQQFELPHFLAVEQVLVYANPLPDDEAETSAEAKELYAICRIDHLLKRRTDQLSGGERQRVALALALITAPRLLLLDEPFSNLDMIHKNILKAVIDDVVEKLQTTCILVSHDPLDTLSWADEIIVMKAGAVVQKGTPRELYNQPANEYVAGLFGKYNVITSAQAKHILHLHRVPTGKNLLIRPENFIVHTTGGGTRGTVHKVFFYGSYIELEVLVAGNFKVIARVTDNAVKQGDTVYISITDEGIGYT